MRVTERSMIAVMSLAQARAAERLDKASRAASSGMRVTKPSDDPAAWGSKVRRDQTLAMLDEHSASASRARSELDVAQNALSAGIDIIERAQESALSGVTGTVDADARKVLAVDVRTMRDELYAIANTRYGNKYLFGGTRTDSPPFDPATGTFSGNDQVIRIPILDGVALPANVSGARAFTALGGRDLFADLDALANALDANDEDAIRAATAPLKDDHAQLVRSQVEAGLGAERFRNAVDVLMTTKASVTEQLSKEVDGDPGIQLTELTLAKTAYERTIAVTKQLLMLGTSG